MIWGAARFVPDTQESRRYRIELRAIEFEKVALGIDQDVGLQGSLGGRVVADEIVGEIVPDFEGEEEARARHVRVPVEDGLVDDGDFVGVALGRGGAFELLGLEGGEVGGDFDDAELGAGVDVGVCGADIVEDVEH